MSFTPDNQTNHNNHRPGRPRAIPMELFVTVLALYESGLGYRSIANHLRGLGISATFSSVRRLVKGEGTYARGEDSQGIASKSPGIG